MSINYQEVTEKLLKGLSQYKGFYSRDYYLEIEDRITHMRDRINESKQEGRLLKIGIVGEVKAGKSSFLNALVFNGADILPKASTPMTAALTKITYSENQSARIIFYSQKDWNRIEEISGEYDRELEKLYEQYLEKYENQKRKRLQREMDEFGLMDYPPPLSLEKVKKTLERPISNKLKACKELTELARKSSINIYDYIGNDPLELEIADLQEGLHDYIGVNGKYSSIVKHVELQMNNEMLKDIEIVDTPGLNDPIISRSETTKKFLRNCDVVFLLSYCGQFLTQSDISFMRQTLPNEGIKNVIIVGSKFDSGILDDNKSKRFNFAANKSAELYRRQAADNIERCLTDGYNKETILRIKESLPPSFVSSILYSCAVKKKNNIPYSAQEKNIINQLKLHFEDFEDEYKVLLSLSGIPQIKKQKLVPIMETKKEIIEEKNRELLSNNKSTLLRILEDINIQAIQNRNSLKTYDKNQLEKKLKDIQEKLNSIRIEIKNIFENSSVDASQFLNNIKVTIDKEIENYVDFDVTSTTTTRHGSYREGFFGLKRTHYTYEEVNYHASVPDVIANLRGYITRCKEVTNDEFDKIINVRKLKESVKETVISAFDLSGRDFNENDILIPLEIVVKKIKIPHIDIEVAEFEPMILEAFSDASVSDEKIHELRLQENRALEAISTKIKSEIDQCEKRIENAMQEQAATFVDNIIRQLTDNMENIKSQIDNKENAIRAYDNLCNAITEYKQMVIGMEM